MIHEKIDELIANAIKDKAHASNLIEEESIKITLEVFRAVKTELATAGYNATHIPTDDQEIAILKDMIAKRKKAADIYKNAGEQQRAINELDEADIIFSLLPDSAKGPTKEQVEAETICVIKNFIELKSLQDTGFDGNVMRFTKDIIAKVKEKYPEAENGMIAAVVKSYK